MWVTLVGCARSGPRSILPGTLKGFRTSRDELRPVDPAYARRDRGRWVYATAVARSTRCWRCSDDEGKNAAVRSTIRAVLTLLFAAQLAACGKKIGDACKTAFDCNQTDENRTCDISQPGGYCILEGCDQNSCPDEAACVRFYPRLNLPSQPGRESPEQQKCDPANVDGCGLEGVCIADGDGSTHKCAPRTSEFRRCMLTCDKNGDCRDGYECRVSGTYGSVALTDAPGARVQFCSPQGR